MPSPVSGLPLIAKPQVTREERSATAEFIPYRERSTQAFLYTHTTNWLVNEFDFRHVSYHPKPGQKSQANQLWQASFTGKNLTAPMEFKVGRHWTGQDRFHCIDGGTWDYRWGNRLSTIVTAGQFARIDETIPDHRPQVFEGRLHYRFNDQTFFALGGGQDDKKDHSLAQLGWKLDTLRLLGEHRSTGATDTWRVSMQYLHPSKIDLLADYRVEVNDGKAGGLTRALVAYDAGRCYIEGAVGNHFRPDEARRDNRAFYEGSLTFGKPDLGLDGVTLSYLLERGLASDARTISGTAERKVSDKTRLFIDLSNTRFEEGRESLQNLGGRLHRRVEWGYYELGFALITGGNDPSLQKDVNLRAGLEF